jgi:glycosyltransferase involved in cell wall biosynthesis
MVNKFFSIVIPTRERHDTLKYSIQSVINQTYKDFELVIMDNYSSPETASVVALFNDERINYYRSPERLSMSDNWELGLSKATGEYVFVLGDDDALMPDGLEVCLNLINKYNVKIISWFRSQYWWPNAVVPWNRNRLFLNLSHMAYVWNTKDILQKFYQQEAMFEHLPMLYNSFVNKSVISQIKSVYGKYFMSAIPDAYSGIVNAYFSDTYLYSFRNLSLAGLSRHSTGTSTGYSSLGSKPLEDFIKEQKRGNTVGSNPILVSSNNLELTIADVQIRTKELFFPDDKQVEFNLKNLLNVAAARINRDPSNYQKTLKDIKAIAQKNGISISELDIPAKLAKEPEAYQGPIGNPEGAVSTLVINCEQVGVAHVAQAAMLAQGILPRIESLDVNNIVGTFKKQDYLENPEQAKPKIVVDGVFFQLYQTGIARVWRSLLEEWAENGFAKYIVVLDRAGTAPKMRGIWYRNVPRYDYTSTDADREMLQQVCDEEGADLFISSYYTTPLTTPSVFMTYDMVPEVVGANLDEPMWREKHNGIRHAGSYITISENTARDLLKVFPNISSDLVTVAHCGVKSTFSPATLEDVNRIKTKYGISKPYFIVVGAGNGYKNTILFFQAFSQLYSKHGFEIVCTGSGALLQDEFRAYTSGSVVHMLQLCDEELKAAYSGAVALVYPSQYEGFGLPVLEAIACGCPVITCPNSSIPEVAGKAALYVNDADINGLANALCDVQKPEVRSSLIAAGLEQAKNFSWSKMAKTVSSALIDATLLPLKVGEINLIAFPDWEQPEESLALELEHVIRALATHPDRSHITLLIHADNISDDDANLVLSTAAMNLLMQEDLDVSEGSQISLIGNLAAIQWEALFPRLHGRIVLEDENQQAIAAVKAENIPTFDLYSFSSSIKLA